VNPNDNNEIDVQFPPWEDLINEKFIPLIENKSRVLVLYGGRGSSKSNFVSKKIVYMMLDHKYFKGILIRDTQESIKESCYREIEQTISEMGLNDLFKMTVNPLEITCIENGNKVICRGLDNPTKLKSLKDYSFAWYEETTCSTESDYLTVSLGIRTTKAEYLQEIFTINTDFPGDYEQNWFYKRYFSNHTMEKDFTDVTYINVGSGKNERTVKQEYTAHHSTYQDNRFISDEYRARLEQLRFTDPYQYTVYTLGEFGRRETGGLYFRDFSRALHTYKGKEVKKYNSDLPLHLTVDFNVVPYMSATVWQVSGLTATCIDEIITVDPFNNTRGLCNEFIKRYRNHTGGLYVYGDASGKKDDTRTEKGHNNYTLIQNYLEDFHPTLRVPGKNPNIKPRRDFINNIFAHNQNGISISVNDECVYLLNDFAFVREAQDGGKLKETETKDNRTYQKYSHTSDGLEYFICEIFKSEFNNYQRGNKPPIRIFQPRKLDPRFYY
jgi:phage terminase large subunit